jgi:hypothetical protein
MYRRVFIVVMLLALLAVPALAQEDNTHTVSFDGFWFTFDAGLAQNVHITQRPGDPAEGAWPGFSDAARTQFVLSSEGQPLDSMYDTGGLTIYRMADLAQYDFLQAQVEHLAALLAEKPDLQTYVPADGRLPYVPVLPHGQVARAQAEYVETETLQGIRYLVVTRADLGPFEPRDFSYAFQGMTRDGQYYVTANFILTTDLFPGMTPDYNPETFHDQWPTYLEESIATVNEAAPGDFAPSLDVLDAVIQSIRFG